MKEIVIATRNLGKLEEFKVLMKDLEVELRSFEEWPNVPEPEETGKTFMANARLKAVYYAKETGLPCIADDSGLEVLALEGAPGVRSARYAGEEATDEENNKLLLQEPLGTEGFGYDPLFWSTELHKGMGEATMQEKNKISHRGKAIKKLVANWGKMK